MVARPGGSALLIRQVFFTAPNVPQLHALGPVRASRAMRSGMRALVRKFTEIGIPATRVALELQFQSAPGTGGREKLQPRAKWLEIVKLQALAVRRVTKELRTHSIWSWGWATFSAAGIDPDKGEAVCVYLWVRDQNLCSGPGAAGPAMNASLTIGQLEQLGAGVVCASPQGRSGRARSIRWRGRSATGTSPPASCWSGSSSSRRSNWTRARCWRPSSPSSTITSRAARRHTWLRCVGSV